MAVDQGKAVEIGDGLWLLDLRFLGEPNVVAAYLIAGNGELALIETGPSSTLPALRAGIRAAGFEPEELTAILVTHIHLDHAGAAGVLVRECPEATVYVHPIGAPHMIDPSKLLASATRIYGDQMDRLWGEVLPIPAERIVAARGRRAGLGRRPGADAALHARPRQPPRRLLGRGERHRLYGRRRRHPDAGHELRLPADPAARSGPGGLGGQRPATPGARSPPPLSDPLRPLRRRRAPPRRPDPGARRLRRPGPHRPPARRRPDRADPTPPRPDGRTSRPRPRGHRASVGAGHPLVHGRVGPDPLPDEARRGARSLTLCHETKGRLGTGETRPRRVD